MSDEVEKKEMDIEESQEVEEKIESSEPEVEEKPTFQLADEHVEILGQHGIALQNFYAMIGQQLCEILKNVNQASSIEQTIEELQNDIAKELKVPRANRLSWNLAQKTLEVID